MKWEKVTVFCAASEKCDKIYFLEAQKLGEYLAKTGRTIIFGGGKIGLMGALADASIQNGGKVIGIIPHLFDKIELGHKGIDKMHIVNTLHQREEKLMKDADCIVALPGGIGTFSELMQAIVWKRFGLISAEIFIVNSNNYFFHFLEQLKKAIDENFYRKEFDNIWNVCNDVKELINYFEREKTVVINNRNLA